MAIQKGASGLKVLLLIVAIIGVNKCYVDAQVIALGPWGGTGGNSFNDGVFAAISAVDIGYNDDLVVWIRTTYVNSQGQNSQTQHGTGNSITQAKGDRNMDFDYANNRVLYKMDIYVDTRPQYLNRLGVVGITLYRSDGQTLGPLGSTIGTKYTAESGKFVGFFGRSADLLDQLGIYALTTSSINEMPLIATVV